MLFTYLHLAPAPELTQALIDSGATCVAYETVETDDHRLPLLAPMSEVAGRLAPQMGAHALEKAHGGRGVLLGGVAGVPPGKVAVLGGGIVGYNAALIAVGMQADVWVLDRSIDRMRELDPMLDGRATVAMSNTLQVEEAISEADLVIGAVLVHGARAPKLVTRDMLGLMKPGSVLVDVAIDQGGCFETSRPTTHSEPTYEVDGIVHYCVANMPGAVPMTSTRALTNATLPYVEAIAEPRPGRRGAQRPRAGARRQRDRGQGHLRARRARSRPPLHPALRDRGRRARLDRRDRQQSTHAPDHRDCIGLLAPLALACTASRGGRRPRGRRAATIVIKVKSVTIASIPRDKPPKGASKGDRMLLRDRLVNVRRQFGKPAGAVVGRDEGVLVLHERRRRRRSRASRTLPGGTIRLHGVGPRRRADRSA